MNKDYKKRPAKNHKHFSQQGWATLELVMLLPLIVGLIAVVFYFGQLAFVRLHLTSVTDAGARVAAVKDCGAGVKFIKESISGLNNPLHVECSSGDYITLTVKTQFQSAVPFFDSIEKPILISASTLNEKKWASEE